MDERALVGLLHRADWTRLSLSAEVSDGSSVLIAPGKRYWYQDEEYATGCDGGRPWELSWDDDDQDGSVHWVSGPEPPLPRMLCPAWLLEDSVLRVNGRVRACGRDAIDVVMTERTGQRDGSVAEDDPAEPVRVLVDAELGILLRIAEPGDGGHQEVAELVNADFDPVIDPERFAPPPGSRIAEGFGESLSGALGPAWWAAKTAAGLAAGALGAWIQYSPFRRARAAAPDGIDFEAAIPRDEPPPERSPDGVLTGQPVSDDLLAWLHAGGPDEFAAMLHRWIDVGALASSVPAAARRAGFGGLGRLMDAISDQPGTAHVISRIRIGGQGRYQIDHSRQPRRGPKTIACDGHRRWQVYPDKILVGPAEALPGDIRDLSDPSWLLRCWLSGGTTVPAGNRSAHRINAARRADGDSPPLIYPAAVAVIDADLRLILRLTSYIGARPVQRDELRDVTAHVGDFRVEIPSDLPTVEAEP